MKMGRNLTANRSSSMRWTHRPSRAPAKCGGPSQLISSIPAAGWASGAIRGAAASPTGGLNTYTSASTIRPTRQSQPADQYSVGRGVRIEPTA